MHEEKNGAVPLPAAQPEVGDRISPPLPDGPEDYAVEERVIASDGRIGYTRKELRELADRDAAYQRLCRQLQIEREIAPPTFQDLERAKWAAKKAFLKWQEMQNFQGLKTAALEKLETQMFRRMHLLAMREAARSIRNIQAVMGIKHLTTEFVPAFQGKRFGRRASRATAIGRTLAEPLAAPEAPSSDESTKTPN